MQEIDKAFSPENGEIERNKRSIVLYLLRHGEASSYAKDAVLTGRGKEQASQTALQIAQRIKAGECVRFVHSPILRASQTVEEMERNLQEVIRAEGNNEVHFASKRPRSLIGDIHFPEEGAFYETMKASPDSIGYWMQNPSKEVESPDSVLAKMSAFVGRIQRLAKRLPDGPTIHIFAITHAGDIRVLAKDFFNQDIGNVGNYEGLEIHFPAGEIKAEVFFREQRAELYPEMKVLYFPQDKFVGYMEEQLGGGEPDLDIQAERSNPEKGIVVINSTIVPSRLEKYIVEHGKTEIAIGRSNIDPRSTVLRLGLQGYMIKEAQARSIYNEYLLAHEDGMLNELHRFSEDYCGRCLKGRFPDDTYPVYRWKVEIEGRRQVKEMIERGVRL